MIVGGTMIAGSSKKARKTYLRTVQNVQMTSPALEGSRIDNPSIEFSEGDARRLHHPHDDALVVTIRAGDYNIHRVLVDSGSSADILYYPAFQQMGFGKERLVPTNAPLVGFGGARVLPLGVVTLAVTIGDYPQQVTRNVTFLIRRNVQVYVDDMLVKSQREEAHLKNLKETFDTLRSYNIKLNPSKCAFGVTAGNFLGVATLSRFVSKATDRCLPFFRTLKKSFEWTVECQQAFEDLKVYLSSPPLLSPSQPGEELFLYLAISLAAVSAALIREDDKVQRPVYYASKALHGVEERYPPMEKLAFALVTAAHKLKPYFQAHTIVILTDKPLRRAMGSPAAAGRMALWSIELSEFNIQYRPRIAIKGQAVADFIAEFTSTEGEEEKNPQWSIFTDGSSNKKAGGVGAVLKSPEGDELKCMIRLDFPTTNNESEYEALIASLDLAQVVGAANVVVHCDSQVVTSQVNGEYECKGERMKKYWEQTKKRIDGLQAKIVQIPRGENKHAEHLSKAASAEPMITIDKKIGSKDNWTTPLISNLKDGTLPKGKEAARKLKVQLARFVLIKDVLYKRGFSRPYLRCVGPEETSYVMKEVREGICGNHSGSRSLVHKLIRAEYYWPTM
ncbi:uncharacterized protein LOC142639552 [Castanea sativa]|uniref:uncharacterized protein LOC142639552 n=1 Tax=Castanea sativa TaxID=21020 RepID=UPI003F64EF8C